MTFNRLKILTNFLKQRYCNWQAGYGKFLNQLPNTRLFALKVAITLLYSSRNSCILLYVNSLYDFKKLLKKTKPLAFLMQCLTQRFILFNYLIINHISDLCATLCFYSVSLCVTIYFIIQLPGDSTLTCRGSPIILHT